ncbi:MAG: hypothetical protein EXR36_09550 [Betaproteobacteria bacterium]|nr:hypothetical protein [Betaproteobacteria bacterium]
MTKPNPAKDRKENAGELSNATMRWLATLDEKIRPRLLPVQYPRITNRLQELWLEPERAREYFNDTVTDVRGDRRGFSDEVLVELAVLKHHYDRVLHPIPGDVWTKIWAEAD